MSAQPMTKGERNEFVALAKSYARALKADGALRAAQIVEAFERNISQLYSESDDRWEDGVDMVRQATRALNAQIEEHFRALGLNPDDAPGIEIAWRGRSHEASNKERREELRKVAKAEAAVVQKQAESTGARLALEVERKLLLDELQLPAGRDLMKSLPPIEDLMPELNIERIEAIARESDRQGRSWHRLWRDNEPLLTGTPLPAELVAAEDEDSNSVDFKRAYVAERVERVDVVGDVDELE